MNINYIKPYIFQLIGGIGPQVMGIFISSAIVSSAGVDEFGKYALFMGLVAIIFGVIGSALDTNYQRSCQASNYGEVFAAKLIAWLLLIPFILVVSHVVGAEANALLFLFVGVIFQQLVETRVVRDRIQGYDVESMLPRLLPVSVFAIFLHLSQPGSVVEVAMLFTFAWISSLFFIYKLLPYTSLNITRSIGLFRVVSPIWFSLLITQSYGNVDMYIIRFFHSDAEVGAYKIAYTFASISMPLAGVFSFIFLSKISAAVREKNLFLAKRLFRQQIILSLIVGIGVLAFIIVLFPHVAEFLYKEAGNQAIPSARILAVAMTLNMLCMVYVYGLLALGKERLIAFMTVLAGVFYLILSLLIVPIYSSNGAAAAMCSTYLLLLIVYRVLYVREFGAIESQSNSTKSGV
jgi:O-antigen/teichoic acid export membrane protein